MKKNAIRNKIKNVLYHEVIVKGPFSNLFELDRNMRSHTHDVAHYKDGNVTSSRRNSLLLSNSWRWISSWKTDPETQKRTKTHFAGIASEVCHRIYGTQPASDHAHCAKSRHSFQPTRETHQKQQQVTPNHLKQPQLRHELTIRECHCHCCRNGLIGPRQSDEKSPSSMSAWRFTVTPRSSNSKLYKRWTWAHPTLRDKTRGKIPLNMIVWNLTNKVNPEWDEVTPQIYGTYHNFVRSQGYFGVDSPGSQNKLFRQPLDKFIAASQVQFIRQAWHVCESWQLWVNDTNPIGNQMFSKKIFTVTNYKVTLLYLALLSLQLVISQWISVGIQHAPPRCFRAQKLISGKVVSPWKRRNTSWYPCVRTETTFLHTRQ